MTLLAPLALWGTLAVLVPLLLHLRRRRVGRTIQVGTLRHLDTLPTAERRGPRIRDPWRLLLRAGIVTLLALLLARPAFVRSPTDLRPFVLVDSLVPPSAIDSLRTMGDVRLERIDDPWTRVGSLDDSLPPGVPLVIAATSSSSAFHGPRPVVERQVTWYPYPITARNGGTPGSDGPAPVSAAERRALAAALAAVAESFGPLTDTAGWMARLPGWWRDSVEAAAFPIAVATAVAPAKTLPVPVWLSRSQLLPRELPPAPRRDDAIELHWWLWSVVALLLLAERLWARSLKEGT